MVDRWMTRNPATVGLNQTLSEAKRMMEKGNFRRLPIVDGEQLVGIVTDRDLRQQLGQLEHTQVNAIMSKDAAVESTTPAREDMETDVARSATEPLFILSAADRI